MDVVKYLEPVSHKKFQDILRDQLEKAARNEFISKEEDEEFNKTWDDVVNKSGRKNALNK